MNKSYCRLIINLKNHKLRHLWTNFVDILATHQSVITNDTTISKVISENYEYIHVNYNPRKSQGAEKLEQGWIPKAVKNWCDLQSIVAHLHKPVYSF